MPNNLTDAEIKKALECCAKNEDDCTTECPLWLNDESCFSYLIKPILDLINRQEAENEKNENIIRIADKTIATLQAENENLKEKNSNLTSDLTSLQNDLTSAKAEVERLKATIDSFTDIGKLYSEIKAEAYKECIEKVKAENYDYCIDVIYDGSGEVKRVEIRKALFNKQLDNLLNELVGDENDIKR